MDFGVFGVFKRLSRANLVSVGVLQKGESLSIWVGTYYVLVVDISGEALDSPQASLSPHASDFLLASPFESRIHGIDAEWSD